MATLVDSFNLRVVEAEVEGLGCACWSVPYFLCFLALYDQGVILMAPLAMEYSIVLSGDSYMCGFESKVKDGSKGKTINGNEGRFLKKKKGTHQVRTFLDEGED